MTWFMKKRGRVTKITFRTAVLFAQRGSRGPVYINDDSLGYNDYRIQQISFKNNDGDLVSDLMADVTENTSGA